MFQTADWTHPQIGGLLNEIIEKEERQLRAPKPRIEVQHVWDPNTLDGRATTWEYKRPAPQANMAATRSKLGMSAPDIDDSMAQSRTKLIAMRRTRDSLAAMDRERAQDAASTEKGFKSAASLFTPQDLAAMRPTFAPNESYATATSTQLVGYGAKRVPLMKSRFNRADAFPPDFTDSRNGPNRRHPCRTSPSRTLCRARRTLLSASVPSTIRLSSNERNRPQSFPQAGSAPVRRVGFVLRLRVGLF